MCLQMYVILCYVGICVKCVNIYTVQTKEAKFWLVTFWRSGGQKVTGSGVTDGNVTAFTEF